MDKKQITAKLWQAQVLAISNVTPTDFTNCKTAARMLRYSMKLDQMATEHLATNDDANWRAIKASAQSLLEELVTTLPGMLMSIDPEFEKPDSIISLSEAIVEATKKLEEEILVEQEETFELIYNAEEFANLV